MDKLIAYTMRGVVANVVYGALRMQEALCCGPACISGRPVSCRLLPSSRSRGRPSDVWTVASEMAPIAAVSEAAHARAEERSMPNAVKTGMRRSPRGHEFRVRETCTPEDLYLVPEILGRGPYLCGAGSPFGIWLTMCGLLASGSCRAALTRTG